MAEKTVEELLKELRGASQNRKKVRILVTLSDRFYFSDAIVALDYARQGWKYSSALPDDADKALALCKYGRCLTKTSEHIHSREYLFQALAIYRVCGDSSEIATTLNLLGNTFFPTGEYAKAMEYYTEALDEAKKAGDDALQEMLLGNIGLIYRSIGDYYACFKYQSQGFQLAQKIGSIDLAPSYLNLGIAYWDLHEEEKAREYLQKAFEAASKSKDILCIQKSLTNLAVVDVADKNYDPALEKYSKAREIAREQDFHNEESKIIVNIAGIHAKRGDHKTAITFYDEALQLIENFRLRTHLPRVLTLKATSLLFLKKYKEAETILHQAVPVAAEHNEKSSESEMHKLLSECLQQRGDHQSALQHYIRYSELHDECFKQDQKQMMADAHMRLEIESALRERETYRMEKECLEFELHAKQQELTAIALQIAKQNEVLGKLTGQLRQFPSSGTDEKRRASAILSEIDRMRTNDSDWKMFESQFDSIHAGFHSRLIEQYPSLTPKEIRVCALMKLNLSSKDIANSLAISSRTVEVHRLQIRKKMSLLNKDNLAIHLTSI